MGFREFYERYFMINLSDYPNIGINIPIVQLMFALVVGAVIGSVVINIMRSGMHNTVKGLLRYEAKDEESAKTLDEMRINTFPVRWALRSDGRLSRLVKQVGGKEYTYEEYKAMQKQKGFKEEKTDYKTARLYLPDPESDEVKAIFERGGSSPVHTILFCLLMVSLFLCLTFLMPDILTFINNLLEK